MNQSYVLVVSGIKMSNLNVPDKTECREDKVREIFPSSITDPKQWPSHTKESCRECKTKIISAPLFLPTFVTKNDVGEVIGVKGLFCSQSCIGRYIKTNFSDDSARWNYSQLVEYVYKSFFDGRL